MRIAPLERLGCAHFAGWLYLCSARRLHHAPAVKISMLMRPPVCPASLAALLFLTAATTQAEEPSVALFNGRDLTGWVQQGGKAKYSVQDGVIVGAAVTNTGNSFLCTAKAYGDFVLEYDYKVDPRLNSGVQIRSLCFDAPTTLEWQDKAIKVPAGRVHGIQVEIDNDPKKKRWWAGGLYEEGRRGWLYPGAGGGDEKEFTQQGSTLTKPADWNHVRVVAKGDSIETFLNGQPRATIKDDLTPAGFIALQVHGIGKNEALAGATVQWRNLRIQPLTPPTDWTTKLPAK
jgi:hypothetical protein